MGRVGGSSGDIALLIKATGVPIDHYSYDTVETVKDTIARWQTMRKLRESASFAANKDPAVAQLLRTPSIDVYAIDVSFVALQDLDERAYLNNLSTSFVLPPQAIASPTRPSSNAYSRMRAPVSSSDRSTDVPLRLRPLSGPRQGAWTC